MMLVLCFGLISCDKDDDKKDVVSPLVGTWREAHHPTEISEIIFNNDNSGTYILIDTSSGKDDVYLRKPFTYDFNEETKVIDMVLKYGDSNTERWKADVIGLSSDKLILKYTIEGATNSEPTIYNRKY
ncbi:hypothetical protein [Clostridium sp.]|uniref:hypothetical protein n=1 Tax=Clostridium sp. TaxID=1506 RepID=UPI003F410E20